MLSFGSKELKGRLNRIMSLWPSSPLPNNPKFLFQPTHPEREKERGEMRREREAFEGTAEIGESAF